MTPEERQAMREKHTSTNGIWCDTCLYLLPGTEGMQGLDGAAIHHKYPCDVIKVLDALDVAEEQLKCKHVEYSTCKCDAPDCYTHDKKYIYCPKCKKKLL